MVVLGGVIKIGIKGMEMVCYSTQMDTGMLLIRGKTIILFVNINIDNNRGNPKLVTSEGLCLSRDRDSCL